MRVLSVPVLLVPVALACACGNDASTPPLEAGAVDTAVDTGPAVNPLDGIGGVELVQGGFMFTEGPQWRDAAGDLVFSDIPANTIYRYAPGSGPPTVYRMPSGNSNGLALDGADLLIAAQHGTRTVTRDGVAIATTFETKKLNSPNDVIVADDGTIYFTDPPYGLGGATRELDFMGVFRLHTNSTLTAEHRGALAERPNGIGLSPDGKTLYVADTADGKLWSYNVQADGSLAPRVQLAMTAGNPDGLAIDMFGNIFVTASQGIEVFAPNGSRWGAITVPQQPANCAFGDADHKTLYITARTALYKVRLANPGLPRR